MLRDRRLAAFKFRRKQIIFLFIVDFVCFEERLIIEADGSQHADNKQDLRRDTFLRGQQFRLLRFWNNEIIENLDGVAQVIAAALLTPHPAQPAAESPSPSRGEGSCGASNGS